MIAPRHLSRFDRSVLLLIVGLLAAIGLLVAQGDRVGVAVLALSPPPQAVAVSRRSDIRVRFDQPLNADPGARLRLSPEVPGEVYAQGDTLVFAPDVALDPDTAYTVTLEAGLRSSQGRQLHQPVTWSFETGDLAVVYSTVDEQGREQLMLGALRMDAGTPRIESPRQVSEAPFGIWDFAADANSGQVVYSVSREDGTSDLWVLRPGAETPELLRACPRAACNSVAFSPDSRLLAFSQRNDSGFAVPVVSPPRLWLRDLESGSEGPLFADSQQLGFDPRWSADGQWLSYLSPDLGGVGVYNLEDSRSFFYATTTGEAAVWHPARPELVMSEMAQVGDLYEVQLYAVDPVAERRTRLSVHEYPVEDNSPAWSPDGEWLAFRRKELEGPRTSLGKQLWLMRADGSEARPLTQAPDFDYGPPVWSPDGRYLLYHRFPLKGPDVTISVWVMEVATQQEWEVARPGQRPQWVP